MKKIGLNSKTREILEVLSTIDNLVINDINLDDQLLVRDKVYDKKDESHLIKY